MSVATIEHEVHTQVTDTLTTAPSREKSSARSVRESVYAGMFGALQMITRQSDALQGKKANDAVHFIIIAAVIVLLALGATVIIGAIAMCAAQGGVYDAMVAVDPWTFEIKCHKI